MDSNSLSIRDFWWCLSLHSFTLCGCVRFFTGSIECFSENERHFAFSVYARSTWVVRFMHRYRVALLGVSTWKSEVSNQRAK